MSTAKCLEKLNDQELFLQILRKVCCVQLSIPNPRYQSLLDSQFSKDIGKCNDHGPWLKYSKL